MELTNEAYVLNTLTEVSALDDVQSIVDRACQCVVKASPFQLALLSLYFDEDNYVGLEGGSDEMRERFLESARTSSREGRDRRRKQMWDRFRIPGTNVVFIPEGSDLPFGPAFTPCEEIPGAEWRPDDRLMVYVHDADREVRGILSLDRPFDGSRPGPRNIASLEAIDRLMQLMGVIITNKYLDAKLRESESRYAAVVEQGHDGILIAREGGVLFANRRLGELLRCDPESLIGRRVEEIVLRPGAQALQSEGEGELQGEDGHRVHVTLRFGEIRIDGAPAELIAVADASERQRMLAQLTRTQKLESVGTLASGMAHDFNNLLGGIVGYAGLLRLRLPADDPARRYVESIERAAGRAAGVTRQLLGIVRDEKARVAPFRIDRVLDEVARLLRETLDSSIKVEVDCADEMSAVVGDESQIHQVLLNICINARDAMPGGGTLTIRADRRDGFVRVRISDTGTGMDPETQARVFDPFFTTKEVGQGSGLGLYMAYRIVERHGGRIDFESEPGRGTTAEILLPVREAATVEEGRHGPGDGVLASGTVLLVDDERLIVEVGTEMLRTLGYRVLSAADGREAVEMVRAADRGLCCVIMDITMPVMDGWEATRRIHELHPELPVVISSGRDVSTELGSGTAGFLRKPYGLGELRAALAAAVSAREPCGSSARAR